VDGTKASLACFDQTYQPEGVLPMPIAGHTKAAENHDMAAKTHKAAADLHAKGDHAGAVDKSKAATAHGTTAVKSAADAHEKSVKHPAK
jgi:tRNA U55 pseudouridine synthase TruB